jgi:hypothetical protein
MVSAVEQLAKNANWGSLAKASELKQRLLFVMLALIVYRLGTYIPVPGIDPAVWEQPQGSEPPPHPGRNAHRRFGGLPAPRR